MSPRGGRAWAAVGGCLIAACQGKSAPPSTGLADGGSPRHRGETRIQVPLPPGWAAQSGADGFRAGPAPHWVFRIDRKPDAGSQLPSPEELQASLLAGVRRGAVSEQTQTGRHDVSTVVFLLSGASADGGVRSTAVMLAAKRIGRDLFLCATLPGQTLADARLAASACEGLWIESD